jgi:hypothetical protein
MTANASILETSVLPMVYAIPHYIEVQSATGLAAQPFSIREVS